MTTTLIEDESKLDSELLEPYVEALLKASGIDEDQARICVLYALRTHKQDLERMPILAIRGMTGTGKSTLLKQMELFVYRQKWASGSTYATVRDEMNNCPTYLIDEGDQISEQLLLCRTSRDISEITYKAPVRGYGWQDKTVDVFGATILARRNPFNDAAVRNRAIVINTKLKPGTYEESLFGDLDEIAHVFNVEKISLGAGRVRDTWTPLIEIAEAIDDPSYLEAIERTIAAETSIFRSGQEYEPELVVLHALDALTWDKEKGERIQNDVELSEVTNKANDLGDVQLIKRQVEELLITNGFKVTYTHGIKYVRANTELLGSLLEGC